jgi:hypothetical protein
MKVIADNWNHSGPKFGEVYSSEFDYRVFLQDEKWLLDGLYSDLATMTPEELYKALEGLFCAAERHYKGMLLWYQNEYNHILANDSVSGSRFLGFLMDYQQLMNKTPHEWLRDSILGQAIEKHLRGDRN